MTTIEPAPRRTPPSDQACARAPRPPSSRSPRRSRPFAGGESVGLDHVHGRPNVVERTPSASSVVEALGSRAAGMPHRSHQVLRPRLGALEPRRLGRRPEHRACPLPQSSSARPATRRTSGPTTVRSTPFASDEVRAGPSGVVGGDRGTMRPARSLGSRRRQHPVDRGIAARAATRARARARRPRPPGPIARRADDRRPRGRGHPTSAVRLCSRPGPTETTPTRHADRAPGSARGTAAPRRAGRRTHVAPPISSSQPSSSS